MKTKIIGHRGGVKGYPENTLSAFKKAVEVGADGVEFDVQLTKDGEVVVIHDELINRTMNQTGFVKDYTLSELKEMEIRDPKSNNLVNQKIPTLQEVLEVVQDLEIINIELKNFLEYPDLETKILKIIKEFQIKDKVIISSYNHMSLQKFKKIAPEIKTGALFLAKTIAPVDYAFKRGFDALHMYYLNIDQEMIDKAHFMGININLYTVNDSTAIKELISKNVDIIMTDNLESALEIRNEISKK